MEIAPIPSEKPTDYLPVTQPSSLDFPVHPQGPIMVPPRVPNSASTPLYDRGFDPEASDERPALPPISPVVPVVPREVEQVANTHPSAVNVPLQDHQQLENLSLGNGAQPPDDTPAKAPEESTAGPEEANLAPLHQEALGPNLESSQSAPAEQEAVAESIPILGPEDVRARLTSLWDLDESSYAQQGAAFIEERLAELEASSEGGRVGATTGNFQGFIGPDIPIITNELASKDYKLDDRTMYGEVMPLARQFYERALQDTGNPERAYLNAALHAAQYAQQGYFGNVHNDSEALRRREALLADTIEDYDTPDSLSIADIKDARAALCTERATVANNVLHVFGVKPVLELGELQIGDTRPQLHAFLTLRDTKGQELIYDPTNPHLAVNEAGRLLSSRPAVYPVGDALSERDPARVITGQRKIYHANADGSSRVTTEEYKFRLNPFGAHLHPQ